MKGRIEGWGRVKISLVCSFREAVGRRKKTRAQNVMWILVKGCAEGQDASESERECGFGFGGESMGSELGVGNVYCCAGQLDSLEEQ